MVSIIVWYKYKHLLAYKNTKRYTFNIATRTDGKCEIKHQSAAESHHIKIKNLYG